MNRGEWEGKKEEEGVKTKVALVQKQNELKKIESSPLTRLPLPPPPLLLPLWFLSDPPLRFEGHCSARKAKKAATVVVLAVVVVVATADKTAQGRRKAISRTLTCHHVNSGPEKERKREHLGECTLLLLLLSSKQGASINGGLGGKVEEGCRRERGKHTQVQALPFRTGEHLRYNQRLRFLGALLRWSGG